MSTSMDNDDDSFIILGTSPGSSLDMKTVNGGPMDKAHLEDALKDLSDEANMAFKAHFKIGDCQPSPGSMMVASTMVTDDSSTEDLQKRFGEILDENLILKETLKQNNDSMKEQFLLIASCQEDMMRTQVLHKEKFEETKELVERLRVENKKLKQELIRKVEAEVQTSDSLGGKSGPSSGLEFVTSPDDDTINKLTAQLELVEKQRRQVLVDNEKLTWQKESLENIIDSTTKERDELKEKLHKLELKLSSMDAEFCVELNSLKAIIKDLNGKLQSANCVSSISSDELTKRDAIIQQLDGKVTSLQTDLKNSQLRVLELENVKLEFTKHKSGLSDTVRMYKEQIQELHNRLKSAQTTVFQPVRVSLGGEGGAPVVAQVKLYDRTLKHLADLLNALTNGMSDSLVQVMGLVASLHDYRLERTSVEQFKTGLADVKMHLTKQHDNSLSYVGQVRNTLSIFEGIFNDYNELLKKSLTKQEHKPASPNVDALTNALMARGQELRTLETELQKLRAEKENTEVLKAQLDLYKSDFEAEREAREKMACEKDNIMTDLRSAQRRIQDLTKQLEEKAKRVQPSAPPSSQPTRIPPSSSTSRGAARPTRLAASNGATPKITGVKKKKISEEESVDMTHESTPPPPRFDCPVCDKPFKTLILLQQHVDSCLL